MGGDCIQTGPLFLHVLAPRRQLGLRMIFRRGGGDAPPPASPSAGGKVSGSCPINESTRVWAGGLACASLFPAAYTALDDGVRSDGFNRSAASRRERIHLEGDDRVLPSVPSSGRLPARWDGALDAWAWSVRAGRKTGTVPMNSPGPATRSACSFPRRTAEHLTRPAQNEQGAARVARPVDGFALLIGTAGGDARDFLLFRVAQARENRHMRQASVVLVPVAAAAHAILPKATETAHVFTIVS